MQWPFFSRWFQYQFLKLQQVKGMRSLALALLSAMLVFGLPSYASFPTLGLTILGQAQVVSGQGQAALEAGNAQNALDYWQEAEVLYGQAGDDLGQWGSQLNQAKALQALGFYRRAQKQLYQLIKILDEQPLSTEASEAISAQLMHPLKVNVWLTAGKGFRLLGEFQSSTQYLEQGLSLANELDNPAYRQTGYVYLGNTMAAQNRWDAAAQNYQKAVESGGEMGLTAQLRLLQTLPHRNLELDIKLQAQQILNQLSETANPHTTLYLTLDLVHWLLQEQPQVFDSLPSPEGLLKNAIAIAQSLSDVRGESYAWGYLGQWYEYQKQWSASAEATQTALSIATDIRADELIYQWQWQQGRVAREEGVELDAIAYYSAAVNTLKPLRQEIAVISRDVQFSFRKQIEPIYRDLVRLLLSPAALADHPQIALEQARQTIEELQLVELNNFFREPCLEARPQPIDKLDPSAAVLYPIILPDQLAVILSVPNQPLIYYSISQPQIKTEQTIKAMLMAMRPTAFLSEQLPLAQTLYQWLIEPAESALHHYGITSLAFVLDGSLRNLPLAALHNGQRYLAEEYDLALSPGLQLLQVNTSPFVSDKPKALVGGLSTSTNNRPPLAGVEEEIAYLYSITKAQVLKNEKFTLMSLVEQAQRQSFDIMHLATHAQFGETDAETFIEMWDGNLDINQLRQLLNQQDIQGLPTTLLVLSACDTAQGNNKAVLGMAGLAVRSGAQATLATLWSVNDRATAEFIQAFYEGWIQKKMTKAKAVQYAQLKLIHSPSFRHPYYWSPFVLVGDWT